MNIKDAKAALQAKCSDYHKYHDRILKTLNIADETPLLSYLEQIKNDTSEWFDAFPMDIESVEALAKPKTGILYLLQKHDNTRETCGIGFCTDLASKISQVWKERKAELVRVRIEYNDSKRAKPSTDDQSVASNEAHATDAVEEQPKKILRKNKAHATDENNQLFGKIEQLEEENAELLATAEEASGTIEALKDDKERLTVDNKKLQDDNDKMQAKLDHVVKNFDMLKDLMIDIMRDKGATDTEMTLLTRLLPII